ncbi:DoxX family protein [Kozakia baliensis]|uniref:DoxX family protein n=1 Tax=Kozakia baliensis TaxID=153496 RepID=A0A1D8UVT1_9PROT|nr:DoxX family protein [Kozakia baliensis]AOX17765.1 DoxX family protein [Kozakia baliensis]GBR23818.1 DoxX family protein [Kozakia baliensis NRIC 0488]GEL65593.1 hypothetical protein KBA01_28790 [Kozakia baliensis]
MNHILSRDMALLIARVAISLLFIIMGWSKAADFAGAVGFMAQTGAPFPWISALTAIVVELGIGLALMLGTMVTPLALVLAVYTVVTGLIGHHFWTYGPGMLRYDMTIHFYKNISIAGGLLVLAVAGPGRYAVSLTRNHFKSA